MFAHFAEMKQLIQIKMVGHYLLELFCSVYNYNSDIQLLSMVYYFFYCFSFLSKPVTVGNPEEVKKKFPQVFLLVPESSLNSLPRA